MKCTHTALSVLNNIPIKRILQQNKGGKKLKLERLFICKSFSQDQMCEEKYEVLIIGTNVQSNNKNSFF